MRMPRDRAILVVGASGVFGFRVASALARMGRCELVLAGRRLPELQAVVAQLRIAHPAVTVSAFALDREVVSATDLRDLGAALVIDAAGPFQGSEPRLARTAIEAGLPYLDLADARDFVAAFTELDGPAKRAGVAALSGLSSTPALSNAALDAITEGWRRIDEVEVVIAPGNRAPRGRSVIEAILSYVGRPVRVLVDGSWTHAPGWGLLARLRLPGIGARWASLCETPDLDVIPARYPSARTVVFRAGLELGVMHLGLWALSLLVRLGLFSSLRPVAPLLGKIAKLLERFGNDIGGMTVTAKGEDSAGRNVSATWALEAAGGSGPNIPALPAAAVARALLEGRPIPPGARAAVGLLPLSDYEAMFEGLQIVTRRRSIVDGCEGPELLPGAMGDAFLRLPESLRSVHSGSGVRRMQGIAQVDGASSRLGRLISRLLTLPAAGEGPVDVTIENRGGGEVWTRVFRTGIFRSQLTPARPGYLNERVGPITFELSVWSRSTGFDLIVESARVGPVRLPSFLLPDARGGAWLDEQGRYAFDVHVSAPILGRLVHYRGWLAEASSGAPNGDEPAI